MLCNQAAGAALSGGKREPPPQQVCKAALRQTRDVHPIDHRTQDGTDFLHNRGQHGLCRLLTPGLGGSTEPDLEGLGVSCEGGIAHGGHFLMEKLVHKGLPHTKGHHVMGDNDFRGERAQIGKRMAAQHSAHLMGRSRQHEHVNAVLLKGAARGSAHRIPKDHTARRQLCLLGVVLRHGGMHSSLIKFPDFLQNIPVQNQGLAEDFADGLLGQVVIGRPQAAGGDENIRPAAGNIQSLLQPDGVVAHHSVPEDIDAQGGEALGNLLGIGVGDVSQQQFGADGNNFGSM